MMGRHGTVWIAAGAALWLLGAVGCQSTRPEPANPTVEHARSEPVPTVKAEPAGPNPTLETVYFDLDSHLLDERARRTLSKNAKAIQKHPEWGTLTIEGYCDERGSDEYNLALGDRRAWQVKQHLQDLGVSGSHLRTISFGETNPTIPGHTESAWRYNRRSEFKTGTHQAAR